MNLPNAISSVRLVVAPPVLLYLAWNAEPELFLMVLILALASDVVDGYVARKYQLQTELGAKLDSYSDFAMYLTMAIGAWWLWPETIREQAPFVIMVVLSLLLPALVGLIKFRGFTSYHTWGVKFSALLLSPAAILMFIGGPVWPFQLVAPLCALAALEEIIITLMLSERRSNVRSLWHALKSER